MYANHTWANAMQDAGSRSGRVLGRLHHHSHCYLRHLHHGAVERRMGFFRQPLRFRLPPPSTSEYQYDT